MHVLIIPSWYPSDPSDISGSFFREQALALRKHGCQVAVIYPQLRALRNWRAIVNGKRGIEVENDQSVVTYRSHGTNWFPRIRQGFQYLWVHHGLELFQKYIKAHGTPDIIHAHSMLYAGALASEIKSRYGVPFIITEHNSAFARDRVSQFDLVVARKVQMNAVGRYSVSPQFSELLSQIFSNGSLSWSVIPNIVSQEFIDRPLKKSSYSKSFNFLNVALLNENKRQKNIILAFSAVFKENSNVSLTIGGDGPQMLALKNLALSLGVANRVSLPGTLSRQQVLEKMAATDAFVLSSFYETFGIVVIEALALGKPVIATRCGGPESIVRDQDGILVPVDDIDSLGKAMRQIYENSSEFDSNAIRAACLSRFGESAIASRLCSIYSEFI